MALRMIDHGTKEYLQMVHLRHEILRKPLGLTFDEAELEKEKEDILIGAFEDDRLLGCCLLSPMDASTIRLRQMAVPNNMQGKGIGRALMIFAENIARDQGYRKRLCMHARKTAIGFYQKLGYAVSGDEFTEVTIPHYHGKEFVAYLINRRLKGYRYILFSLALMVAMITSTTSATLSMARRTKPIHTTTRIALMMKASIIVI
jgi:predicted GNAT family N-acyltransferase